MNTVRRLMLACAAFVAAIPARGAEQAHREVIQIAGVERSYHVYTPPELGDPAPLLMLLHGSYQRGRPLLDAWTDLATRDGLVLAAPDAKFDRGWHLEAEGPEFFHAIVEAIASRQPIDRQRVYLFGVSGGAVHALTLAVLESEYFAAAAVFAGAWREDAYYQLLPHARRRIPISIFVGDRDPYFPLRTVERTRAAFQSAGHPVSVTQFKRHGHAYDPVADRVNPDAWAFLSAVRLESPPRYQRYGTE